MTREDAKQAILKASKDDESSPKNCIHLLTLHCYLDKIFDEHCEQLQDKDDEIELLKHRVEEAMKPKTCEGCSNLFFDEIEKVYKCSNDVSDDVGYLHGEAVIRNIKDFHCVQHQPKDNA